MLSRDQLSELARGVERLGYSTLWYPEALNYETMALAGFLLSQTGKLIVASGIANIYARDPMASVMGHNTLNSLYGGRFLLGLGVSHSALVTDLRGLEYKQPIATMRTYLDDMDRAWQALASKPAEKHVMLAALGPKMTKLAGERTLGSLPYNVTPAYATSARAILGPDARLCCEQKVCMTTDSKVARAVARKTMAFYLPLPNYRNNWFRLGFTENDLKNGGSDRLLDAMVVWGSADDIRAKLRAYLDNSANQVAIQPIRPDGQPGADWDALEALAPGR
jgi:probable F420-dependent oxidoreductase